MDIVRRVLLALLVLALLVASFLVFPPGGPTEADGGFIDGRPPA